MKRQKDAAPGDDKAALGDEYLQKLEEVNMQSQAFVAAAIREMGDGKPKVAGALKKWFGDKSPDTENQVRRILNSIAKVLINVAYEPGGPDCDDDTYAYVYPMGDKSKNAKKQYVFYMCDYYFTRPVNEQIETLTHEGSHHAVAYTDDIDFNFHGEETPAYGRDVCEQFAKDRPVKEVLKNADSYCFYINDLHR